MIIPVRKIRLIILMLIIITGFFFYTPCLILHVYADQSEVLAIPDDQLNHIMAVTEKNLGQIKTLKTRLIQEKNISLFSEPVMSTGIFLFKSPGKIRLEFFKPFKSILLISEDKISKFEEFNGQWKRIKPQSEKIMGIVLNHIAAWVNGRFNQGNMYKISGRYRPDSIIQDKQAFSLILEPRADEFKKFIQAFELGINSGMDRLDYIIIRESEKDYTKIDFHEDLINIQVDNIYFMGDQDSLPPVPQWW